MSNLLDLLAFPLCIAFTLAALYFRYWQSKQLRLTGRTDMQHVTAAYWGVYAGSETTGTGTVKLPQYAKQLCTSCDLHQQHDNHHLAK
ncbi:MAG TPA: hypothetical protein V6D22_13995 [Candidatus Obscuribacterales bacterium]